MPVFVTQSTLTSHVLPSTIVRSGLRQTPEMVNAVPSKLQKLCKLSQSAVKVCVCSLAGKVIRLAKEEWQIRPKQTGSAGMLLSHHSAFAAHERGQQCWAKQAAIAAVNMPVWCL